MHGLTIRPLVDPPSVVDALSTLLIDTVADGGSVGFMHPLALDDAQAFWTRALSAATRGERIVLGAFDGDALVGTVTLLLDCPPNQPHRAEIGKMMVSPGHRRRGIAVSLLQAAEALAVQHQRTLLVLDTATDEGAAGLYERLGYQFVGEIPDYALKPHGGLTGTRLYFKRIGGAAMLQGRSLQGG